MSAKTCSNKHFRGKGNSPLRPEHFKTSSYFVNPKHRKREMSKRGKKKDEDYASEDEEPNKRPKKSSKADDSDDAADDIVVCEISKNRRVSVRNWQGRVVVDIREFYVKDGKQLPGKKGISLTMDQWNVLREHVDEIDKAVAENS
ncbi:RNA polymerase II transcriptional coactivator KIWI [Coffea arabica]|uniref:RNA polymerase II transcriptional coactivator KIWI n=1 Tax=Coffea arabica TaxID=13443 RepID=A0A6P6TQA0_COFAR|nr:RNA polymerase II transcriptional coactivator KIWI-like [Coffea arabica]XP_027079786.1 RNA polymerase II transcriptional coactivator KIWI-like [Coffea arabica]